MNYTGKPRKIGRPCMIRIRGEQGWLRGVWTGGSRARVTERDPIWHGAEVSVSNAQLRHLHETEK